MITRSKYRFEADLLENVFKLDVLAIELILKQSKKPFIATVENRYLYDKDSVILSFDGIDLGCMVDHMYTFDSFKDERMFING